MKMDPLLSKNMQKSFQSHEIKEFNCYSDDNVLHDFLFQKSKNKMMLVLKNKAKYS